ncbi:zinc finger BED domain-containing protein RICESLEEPER 2-like [Durio zibethinus]|uniref:Zinc finger BED domain-containing protein RICESLEEPER 2-like n=1 Tax=Durio zibethinus TaxID=66656 RepID=A0A6P5ZP98_DURZI|nr:zinc finger BED domain-containing protein RICESLEEPER 2-like [Durio zibethinus]
MKAICNYCKKKLGGVSKNGTSHLRDHSERRELAKMIINHEYLLSMVDYVQFEKYSYSLQPLFAMPSRNTIKSDILKIFKEKKAKTISKLKANEGRIAITTDMWTADHQKRGYIAVIAHYIDNQ